MKIKWRDYGGKRRKFSTFLIVTAVNKCLEHVNANFIGAVAVTTMPGREICLQVGLNYAKELCHAFNLPLIPVHHMRAHAVVARMCSDSIRYPFLTLLISGGHCLLAVAKNVDEFYLLGESIDIAPGHFLDCVANELGLAQMGEFKVRVRINCFQSP